MDNVVKAANYINEKIDELDNTYLFVKHKFYVDEFVQIIDYSNPEIIAEIIFYLGELFEENGYHVDFGYDCNTGNTISITISMPCATV